MKGLRQFLDEEQQRAWLDGEIELPDAVERTEHLEHRFKYVARFEKLLKRPQVEDVLDVLRLYGATCLPIPRTTERYYWSVSCLPSTSDKPLTRVNASWMELFTLSADPSTSSGQAGLRSRIILHLSDFTVDGSSEPEQLDTDLLESCALRPEDMSYSIWRDSRGILIAKVRGAASIRHFLQHPHGLRSIRNFNLSHMNRGRNAYQFSTATASPTRCSAMAEVSAGPS